LLLAYSQSVTLRSDTDSNIPRAVTNNSDNCSKVPKEKTMPIFPVAITIHSNNGNTYGQSDNDTK
jgi:hypothetical protein